MDLVVFSARLKYRNGGVLTVDTWRFISRYSSRGLAESEDCNGVDSSMMSHEIVCLLLKLANSERLFR